MKERPILFSAPMVRAILAGTKTQTRRVVKGVSSVQEIDGTPWPMQRGAKGNNEELDIVCPYGVPGDRLWVKETMKRSECGLWGQYAADGEWVCSRPPFAPLRLCWHSKKDGSLSKSNLRSVPSIHMPRRASRITLEIVRVRVERVQDATLGDICKEGLAASIYDFKPAQAGLDAWRQLWESINGAESWKANPWVWVIEFRRTEAAQ